MQFSGGAAFIICIPMSRFTSLVEKGISASLSAALMRSSSKPLAVTISTGEKRFGSPTSSLPHSVQTSASSPVYIFLHFVQYFIILPQFLCYSFFDTERFILL